MSRHQKQQSRTCKAEEKEKEAPFLFMLCTHGASLSAEVAGQSIVVCYQAAT
jgi:hypothetical protein